MRTEFRDLISGWTLISGRSAISERLAEMEPWIRANSPLEPDEQKYVELMIQTEIARGFEEGDFEF